MEAIERFVVTCVKFNPYHKRTYVATSRVDAVRVMEIKLGLTRATMGDSFVEGVRAFLEGKDLGHEPTYVSKKGGGAMAAITPIEER